LHSNSVLNSLTLISGEKQKGNACNFGQPSPLYIAWIMHKSRRKESLRKFAQTCSSRVGLRARECKKWTNNKCFFPSINRRLNVVYRWWYVIIRVTEKGLLGPIKAQLIRTLQCIRVRDCAYIYVRRMWCILYYAYYVFVKI